MVKKLFKHEYLAWLRVLPLIYGITLAIAGLLRVLVIFENDSVYYDLVFGSAVFMFVVGLLVTLAAPTVFGILRFYKNLFSGEGYLTHTLPVTPANHLWVKSLVLVSFDVLSVLVALLAGMLVTVGEVLTEIFKAIGYILGKVPAEFAGHLAGWAGEFLVLMIVAAFCSSMLFYFCICVGQLSRKNRKLAAVGTYFGLYVISQVLGTILTVAVVFMGEAGILDQLTALIEDHPKETVHIFLSGYTLLMALCSALFFWICHSIIRKKLNLE